MAIVVSERYSRPGSRSRFGIRDSVANATETSFSLPYGLMATPEPKEMTGRAAVRPGGTLGYREMRISVLSVSRVSFVP